MTKRKGKGNDLQKVTRKTKDRKYLYHLLSQKFVLNRSSRQFRGVSQSMKQTYLYLWFPLFQAHLG